MTSAVYEELDHHPTPLGDLILRRRRQPGRDEPFFEITLGGAFLMSSLVNESERALARLALAEHGAPAKRVLVGGLGLGYTAHEALRDPSVRALTVVELLPEVVAWHERGLLPLGHALVQDPRCRLAVDDFFALAAQPPAEPWDVVLVDIDHAPEALLRAAHARFYEVDGLQDLYAHLAPGGVFGLWAGGAPEAAFVERLRGVFEEARAETIPFFNPHVSRDEVNTIYLARRRS
ncbi:MAG: spermidine synthase [Planctomycetota bacterium]